MTVTATDVKFQYLTNGVTKSFAIGCPFVKDEHIEGRLYTLATGIETVVEGGYTITGAGEAGGGAFVFDAAPADGQRFTVRRLVPYTQETDYVENTAFPADAHEAALDLLTMQNQQQAEELSRAVRLSPSAAPIDVMVPVPIGGRGIKFNAGGTALTLTTYDPDEVRTAVEAAQAAAEDASANASAAAVAAATSEVNADASADSAATSLAACQVIQAAINPAQFETADADHLFRDVTASLAVGYESPVLDNGDSGAGTITPNIRLRAKQKWRVTGNITIALPTYEGDMEIMLVNDGTSRTVIFDAGYVITYGAYTAGGVLEHSLFINKRGTRVTVDIVPLVAA